MHFKNMIESPFWKLQTRCLFNDTPVFKVKRISQNTIVFNLPQAKRIVSMTTNFDKLLKIFKFSNEPQSLQHYIIDGSTYVIGGCYNGFIEGFNYDDKSDNFILREDNHQEGEVYVNDIKYLGNHQLINCYNNGTIAIWNLQTKKIVKRMVGVHKRFTYKLKIINERLFSCGFDGNCVVTDLQKCKVVRVLKHINSVWGLHNLSYNQVSTAGLFGSLMMWDVRSCRVVQYCPLVAQQTSFITKFSENELVLGDGREIVKCNLKMFRREKLSFCPMLVSAEGIQMLDDGGIVCGRGFQICKFVNSETLGQVINNYFATYNGQDLLQDQPMCDNMMTLEELLAQQLEQQNNQNEIQIQAEQAHNQQIVDQNDPLIDQNQNNDIDQHNNDQQDDFV